MNLKVPDQEGAIPHSPQSGSGGARAKFMEARGQPLSLYAGMFFVAFWLISSLWIGSHRRFWYDEISTVLIARLPDIATIWKALTSASDVLPPSYFVLVRLFDRAFGPTELAARIPSALALAAGLLITFDCVRRLTDNLHALASLALLSCSLLPYYGYEARPYGLYYMFAATQLWLWVHGTKNRKTSTFCFGLTFFLAFSVHYYTVLCVVPYAFFEASRWKPWKAPSSKLLAAVLGILCGLAVFSRQILSARTLSHGFWAAPSRGALFEVFGEFFPSGLFIVTLVSIWIAWMSRPQEVLLEPMSPSERLGWYFLLIPLAGYAAALFVTNAFFNRYFLGMLPGVAIAFACALWRHFHQRPGVSAGIVLIMLFMGVGHQVTAMAKPRAINPPSNGGGAARLSELMAWESIMAKDGKKNLAVPADRLIDVEARYYSKYPERYASVLTPGMGVIAQVHRNFAPFQPVRFWNLEDLRAAARDTALIEPSDELLKAVANAGIQVRPLATEKIKLFYLE